ncbi:MAG: hypothetical protein GX128_06550 [Bacteroidales bacterium]|jgi:hypothetical protein|nr:hypothetical protein [Bacteroidales bacterium]
MTNKQIVFAFLVIIINSTIALGQTGNGNLVFWSATKKLTVEDFGIKVRNENNPSFAQFSVEYQVNGFDFLTKNFNKKVRNYVIVSASWIDTTNNVLESLRYQQTLFDLCEIYTRQFRKELKENRKKIASGIHVVEELHQKIMTEFANRRVVYDIETNYGLLTDKQLNWENQIQKQLEELKDYAFNK